MTWMAHVRTEPRRLAPGLYQLEHASFQHVRVLTTGAVVLFSQGAPLRWIPAGDVDGLRRVLGAASEDVQLVDGAPALSEREAAELVSAAKRSRVSTAERSRG